MLRSEDEEIVIIFRTDYEVTHTHLQLINTGFKATVRASKCMMRVTVKLLIKLSALSLMRF